MKKIYFWLSLLFICTAFQSEQTAQIQETEHRLALVIGNGAYKDIKTYPNLDNPTKDADVMTKKLTDLGFDVITQKNLTLDGFNQAVNQFYRKAEELHNKGGKLVTVFYYAGHGEQVDDLLYLVPVNCEYISKADFNKNTNHGAFSLQIITDRLENLSNELNIFMIDACRNPKFRGGDPDMFKNYVPPPPNPNVKKTSGMFYAFATLKGHLVPDGSQYNSYFVEGFVKAVDVPNRSLEEVLKETSKYVVEKTNYKQTPNTENRNFFGDFYFQKNVPLKETVKSKLEDPFENEMIFIEGGTFDMGSNESKYSNERPVRTLILGSFYMSKYEITRKQWKTIMGSDSVYNAVYNTLYNDDLQDYPILVSYDYIQVFLKRLNAQTGKNYRLPTEAEWEYAARGGNKSKRHKYTISNDKRKIRKCGNFKETTDYKDGYHGLAPIGSFRPNKLGLYDMLGNVQEVCSELTEISPGSSSSYMNFRGGCYEWGEKLDYLTYRTHEGNERTSGFRLAL